MSDNDSLSCTNSLVTIMVVINHRNIPRGPRCLQKVPSRGEYGKQDQVCYRCGMKGHWSRICRTPKHIVDLYQELHGKKKAKHEANFVESKRLEKGECSKNADKEPAVPKPLPEEKEAAPSGKNFGAMDIDDNDEDDFGEEYEDMHGDTA